LRGDGWRGDGWRGDGWRGDGWRGDGLRVGWFKGMKGESGGERRGYRGNSEEV
jgi:hypothetical protein